MWNNQILSEQSIYIHFKPLKSVFSWNTDICNPQEHGVESSRQKQKLAYSIVAHVCWKPELWSQQRQPLLGNSSANMPAARQWLQYTHMQQHKSCWKLCFLCSPCQGYSCHYKSVWVYRKSAGRQIVDSCKLADARGQFGNPDKGEHPSLEATIKQCNDDCDWKH
jgi:hypothetical protein